MTVATGENADERDFIALSALQHYLFCPRQCALIHVEQLWAEDAATMEGKLLHEAVDAGAGERRSFVRVARGVALRSHVLGVAGRADVVEFHGERPFPVEYKRGKPKSHRADEVQLCAQALCLEEMLSIEVPAGALFYGERRRRMPVAFDAHLRALTQKVAIEARAVILNQRTPRPQLTRACRKCSLELLCQPASLTNPPRIGPWLAKNLRQTLADDD